MVGSHGICVWTSSGNIEFSCIISQKFKKINSKLNFSKILENFIKRICFRLDIPKVISFSDMGCENFSSKFLSAKTAAARNAKTRTNKRNISSFLTINLNFCNVEWQFGCFLLQGIDFRSISKVPNQRL